MGDVGKTPMAGQELRLLHIAADAGDGCGILTGLTHSRARTDFIQRINAAVQQQHGTPIRAFLERLTLPETLA